MATTTWRKLLLEAMEARNETISNIEANTMSDADMDVEFDDGFGGSEGCAFTVWTKDHVYFPAVYDGSEWVSSVKRNPCDEKSGHVGGE